MGDSHYSVRETVSPANSLLKKYDVVCITTDHTSFDYNMIATHSKVVVDTRNACKKVKNRKRVVLLGDGK